MTKKPLSKKHTSVYNAGGSTAKSDPIQQIKKMAERALDENEIMNDSILAQIPASVYWMNKDYVYLGCTDSMAELLQLESRHAIVGKSYSELFDEKSASYYRKTDRSVIETGISAKIEEPLYFADGTKRIYLSHKSPLYDSEQNIIGMIAISTDITKLKILEKELEEAKQKAEASSQAKSAFIANMSHDIRTPLTGIVGLSEVLIDEAVKDEVREYAKMLHLSGEQLLSLLNSVLDVVASNNIDEDSLDKTTFSLHALLSNICELELPAIELKNLELVLKVDDTIPDVITSDKGKIYRILLNILSNSIKFTDKGVITLEVEHTPKNEKELSLTFIVSDTGIGIPKTEIDKIFTPFYRVHPSYEGHYQGSGIGLHLVKKYVDVLDGTIEAKSIESMGSRFVCTIPVEVSETIEDDTPLPSYNHDTLPQSIPAPATRINDTVRQDNSYAIAHVLLVEDNPMAMQVAASMCLKNGCTIQKAFNASDALKLFEKEPFDFVISDIGLPDYSGFTLTQKMRELEQEKGVSHPTPVIGLTAHAKQEAFLAGNQSGMLEVFEKPLTQAMLQGFLKAFGKADSTNKETSIKQAPQRVTELPLLDVELGISQLGSLEDLKEMLSIMLTQPMVITTADIDTAFHAKDWKEFKKLVHKFKSSCLYCATTKLLKHTQELEKITDAVNESSIDEQYQAFQECVNQTKHFIASFLSSKA